MVKFEISTIDEKMLMSEETKIEDLERQKVQTEKKISEVLSGIDIRLSNELELEKKVQSF